MWNLPGTELFGQSIRSLILIFRPRYSWTIHLKTPIDKDWKDTNAFRIGLTYGVNDYLTLMGGFAYDETPVPGDTIGFELPDSDAWIYSLGAQYKVNEQLDLGIAALYDYKESRKETSDNGQVDGEFTNASAFLITVGMNYKF